MLLIRGGRVIDPANDTDAVMDLAIENGVIVSAGEGSGEEKGCEVIDASGLVVSPGFVDVHAHFRDPGQTEKETLTTGAQAAAAGGYTSLILMANTEPAIDSVELYRDVMKRAEAEPVHLYQAAAVTLGRRGKAPVDMEALKAAGVRGFTDDGSPLMNEALVREAMKRAAVLGIPLSFHEEDPAFVSEAGVNAGAAAAKLGLTGADRQAEIVMVRRDLELAFQTGAVIDIQHVSAAESVELIREAKKKDAGNRIHAEATPHHFSLTENAVSEYGTNAKVNPPIRLESDRQAIIKGIADGTLDLIATDHAPHTTEEKQREFTKAPSGMIGLETALGLAVTNLVKPGYIGLKRLIELMSMNPARLYGLPAGSLAVGMPADITIFSLGEERIVTEFRSRASNSPFRGKRLTGTVKATICRGRIIYEDWKA